MRPCLKYIGFIALALALGGCATVEPAGDYASANRRIQEAVGPFETFDPDREDAIERRVEEVVADGLTLDEAVTVALLNNPSLRAAYARVGMARADVVQSKLLANPVLGLSFQFPEAGGRSNIQASLAQSIVELWQIPVRSKSAQRDLDAAILRLAYDAARLAIDAKTAYYRAVGADASLEIAEENRGLADQLVEVALSRQKAGTVGELDVNLSRGTFLQADLAVMQGRLEAATARRQLGIVLGLTQPVETIALLTPLDEAARTPPTMEETVRIALDSRLDLQASLNVIDAALARVELECRSVFPSLSMGLAVERNERRAQKGRKILADTWKSSLANGQFTAPDLESRGERALAKRAEIDAILGPSISLELPIFDQNQAGIARARYEYIEAALTYESRRRSIIQDARQAADNAATARDVARFYDETLVPQTRKSLDLSRATYEAGRTSLVTVLEAQQALLTSRRAAVKARLAALVAAANLERVTGRPLSAGIGENHASETTTTESGD